MEKLLDKDQQAFLLQTARRAILHHLETGQAREIRVEDPALEQKKGAFVTLKSDNKLRGCIGYPWPHKPLVRTVIDSAIAAATRDYRFDPVTAKEMPRIRIEISVLTQPERVKDMSRIEVGTHGIIVSEGPNKGLLLPQVPVEWEWDLETFLRHGCLKAGLDENAWKSGAQIEIFSAQVFSED